MTDKIADLLEKVVVILIAISIVWLLYFLYWSVNVIVTYDFWGGLAVAIVTCAFLLMTRRKVHAKN